MPHKAQNSNQKEAEKAKKAKKKEKNSNEKPTWVLVKCIHQVDVEVEVDHTVQACIWSSTE